MASFNSTTFLLPNPLVTTTSSLVPFCPVFLKGLHINRWMHTDTFLSTWSQTCIVLQGGSRPPPILNTMSIHVALSSFFNSCLVLDIKWMNHNSLNNTPDNGYLGLFPIFFYYNTLWQWTPCTYILLAHMQYLHGTFSLEVYHFLVHAAILPSEKSL